MKTFSEFCILLQENANLLAIFNDKLSNLDGFEKQPPQFLMPYFNKNWRYTDVIFNDVPMELLIKAGFTRQELEAANGYTNYGPSVSIEGNLVTIFGGD